MYKGMIDDEFDNDSTSGWIAGTEAGCVGGDSENLPKTTAGNFTQECCSIDCDEPYQLIINTNARRKQGQQQRSFQKSWFKKYKWLSFCSTRNAAFCFVCRKAKHLGMLTFNKKGDDAFTSTGFKNWKNALSRFKKHENSESHREATMKYTAALKSPSVSTLISNDIIKEQSIQRHVFLQEVNSLRFLARQGLAFRGHEKEEGNFYQVMNLQAANHNDHNIKHWLSSQK